MVGWLKWGKRSQDEREEPAPAMVVRFTPAARARMLEFLAGKGGAERLLVRISAEPAAFGVVNYGMGLEEGGPREGDTLIAADGIRVVADSASAPYVDGAVVDFLDDPLRPGFKVEQPGPEPLPMVAPGHGHDHAHGNGGAPNAAPLDLPELDLADPTTATVQMLIDDMVNPQIASHGGLASLAAVKDDVVYVRLGGGCQGCAMASVTLKQGVEQIIRQALPQIREVVDVTNHGQGDNPYFASAKGGASPFHAAAKG
jgi:Fe/S biogenesis protein NfuA